MSEPDLAGALIAADRMAVWIEQRHADAHDIVRLELHVEVNDDDVCEGCMAARAYREATNA